MSRRNDIISKIITNLKLIDGNTSTFDPSYTYSKNLYTNVFRGFKFFDGINDYPSVFIVGGTESRIYNSDYLTEAVLPLTIRIFHKSSDIQNDLNNMFEDIEHVLYAMQNDPELGMQDIIIDSLSTDEGLFQPFGFGEISVIARYVLG